MDGRSIVSRIYAHFCDSGMRVTLHLHRLSHICRVARLPFRLGGGDARSPSVLQEPLVEEHLRYEVSFGPAFSSRGLLGTPEKLQTQNLFPRFGHERKLS